MAEDKGGYGTAFFQMLFRRKIPVIAGFVLAAAILSYVASGIRLREDVMDLVPSGDAVVKKYKTVLANFNRLEYMIIDVGPENGSGHPSRDELIKAADTMVSKMSASNHFREIQYRWDVDDVTAALDSLRERRASLFTEEDRAELEGKLAKESIRQTFEGWKKLLAESPAPFIAQAFYRDPLAMDAILMKKLEKFKSMGGQVRMAEGRVFSGDMEHILILAQPARPGTDSVYAKELVDFTDAAAKEAEAVSPGRLHIAYLGSHRFALDNADMIKGDIVKTLSISSIAIILMTLMVYRRPVVMAVLTLLPAFFGGIFASGMVILISPGVSAISFGCGAMLIGLVVDFGIYVLFHADQIPPEKADRGAIVRITDRVSRPMIFNAATTLLAFMTLQLSVLPGYRQLGLFAALGIIGAFSLALLVLPLLIPKPAPAQKGGPVLNLKTIFPPFFKLAATRQNILLIIVAAISFVALFGVTRLKIEGDVQKLNGAMPGTKRDWDIVMKSFGAALDDSSAVVLGKDMDDALEKNEILFAKTAVLQKEGRITGNNSIALLFPGKATQEANRRRWADFWSPERLVKLRQDVEGVCAELRIQPRVVMPALDAFPGSMPPLTLEAFNAGFLKMIAANQISVKPDGVMILTNLKMADDSDTPAVIAILEKTVPSAMVTNGKSFVKHIVTIIQAEMARLGGIILLFVTIAVWFYAKKSGPKLVKLMVPLFVCLFWTFGMMGLLGINIDIMNSIIVIFLIFGVVSDYAVFLLEACERVDIEGGAYLANMSGAITLSALSTIFGLGSLAFARHPALHSIGITSLLGVTFGLVAVFLIIPLGGNAERHNS